MAIVKGPPSAVVYVYRPAGVTDAKLIIQKDSAQIYLASDDELEDLIETLNAFLPKGRQRDLGWLAQDDDGIIVEPGK